MTKKVAAEAHTRGAAGVKVIYKYGAAFSGKKVEVTVE